MGYNTVLYCTVTLEGYISILSVTIRIQPHRQIFVEPTDQNALIMFPRKTATANVCAPAPHPRWGE